MTTSPETARPRFASVDLLRGIVMMLMALDHVRYFFTDLSFPLENMRFTWMSLFFTRWGTHFCAPAFFLLAGTGAAIATSRGSVSTATRFLWTRGLWLIALELTIIGFAWQFIPGYSFAGVIWCLGWAMILLAALVFLVAQMRLPAWTITAHGAAILLLHNLSDHLTPASLGRFEPGWRLLHVPGPVEIGSISWFVLFPVLP